MVRGQGGEEAIETDKRRASSPTDLSCTKRDRVGGEVGYKEVIHTCTHAHTHTHIHALTHTLTHTHRDLPEIW